MNFTPPPNAKERSKALDLALQQIEKQFGKGTIMKLGEGNAAPEIETISTGSIGLDLALGVGGVPRRPTPRNGRRRSTSPCSRSRSSSARAPS